VVQADSIPSTFEVSTPVYVNPGLASLTLVKVTCGVFLDLESSKIQIRTLADEIYRAQNEAQEAIGSKLKSDLPGIPVYQGTP
jgi:hypothetical protein